MSLINDALRKARQEAAEREAEEKGVAYRPPRAHLPERSRMGLGVVLGLIFGFLGAFAGAYLLLRPATTPAPAQEVVQAAPSPGAEAASVSEPAQAASPSTEAAPTSSEASPETASENAPENGPAPAAAAAPQPTQPSAVASPPPPQQSTSSSPADVTATTEPSATAVSASPELSEAPVEATSPATSPAPPASQPAAVVASIGADATPSESEEDLPRIKPPEHVGQVEDTNEFVLEADLGDIQLTLDFIVWVPGRPFAQINGRQVEEGQLVEDLLVEKIERERVTLRGANGRLILRVR